MVNRIFLPYGSSRLLVTLVGPMVDRSVTLVGPMVDHVFLASSTSSTLLHL